MKMFNYNGICYASNVTGTLLTLSRRCCLDRVEIGGGLSRTSTYAVLVSFTWKPRARDQLGYRKFAYMNVFYLLVTCKLVS